MITKEMRLAGAELVNLSGEGAPGRTPADQLAGLLETFDERLRGFGLSLENAVRHRLWTRDRRARDESNDIRARLISGDRRCATSSFIDRERFASAGDVALELWAQYPARAPRRLLVDFNPPRRYAHYLIQGGLLHLSGMAEPGATLDAQFDNAFGEVTAAMGREKVAWTDVLSASLFVERGQGEPRWLIERFRKAVGAELPFVECEPVDGLASTDKHLEIEITARFTAS
jgi:enamine deaminase RidA (YjgF/YER057c/UK114 family)